MKTLERIILPFQYNDFLTPIRDKSGYARLLVCAVRQLLLNQEIKGNSSFAKLKIIIDKMSRLFIYQKNSYFSVSFPFRVLTDTGNNVINVSTYSGHQVDNLYISGIISILDNEYFKMNPSLVNFSIESNQIEYNCISLLEEIIQFEPSYIRYDRDIKNANNKLHPMNHLDINYSQSGTYKLGLRNYITKSYFENLQNISTDCSYIVD